MVTERQKRGWERDGKGGRDRKRKISRERKRER